LAGLFYYSPASVRAQSAVSREELENQIRAKSAELEKINQQVDSTRANLENIQNQRQTLQREISGLQTNIRQLELGIKSDETATQKLSLEITSLNYDIQDVSASILRKQESVGGLMQQIQQSDGQNLLMKLLKSASLAESVLETQSLRDLRTQLAADIVSLNSLKDDLGQKRESVSSKQKEVTYHKNNLLVKKGLVEDQHQGQQQILTQTKNKESVYQQQLSELEKQQGSIEDEIAKIEDKMRAEFNTDLLPTPGVKYFGWPLVLKKDGGAGIITQHYGEVSRLYRGKAHNGLDIGAPIGTPVLAAADGEVMRVDNNDTSSWRKYQYGKYVLIKHNNSLATLYAHLSKYVVSAGSKVVKGQVIGYSGNTGYSTGPHLHFGTYWDPTVTYKSVPPAAGLVPVGVTINPEDYL